jgi:flagellar capping protein FliD
VTFRVTAVPISFSWHRSCASVTGAMQICRLCSGEVTHGGLHTVNNCLLALQTQKELLEKLKDDVGTIKAKYTTLTDKISSTNTKIMSMSRQFSAVPAPGRN